MPTHDAPAINLDTQTLRGPKLIAGLGDPFNPDVLEISLDLDKHRDLITAIEPLIGEPVGYTITALGQTIHDVHICGLDISDTPVQPTATIRFYAHKHPILKAYAQLADHIRDLAAKRHENH